MRRAESQGTAWTLSPLWANPENFCVEDVYSPSPTNAGPVSFRISFWQGKVALQTGFLCGAWRRSVTTKFYSEVSVTYDRCGLSKTWSPHPVPFGRLNFLSRGYQEAPNRSLEGVTRLNEESPLPAKDAQALIEGLVASHGD